ncbi:MAG: iron ABC transporter permease [Cyanobacteria bacterium HKST-UBA02]|nr:iron ABC transporter permease [Cyanobacteria bacterium HKST-UBA02]
MIIRLVILIALAALGLLLNICIGDVRIDPLLALQSVFAPNSLPESCSTSLDIIWQIRLPRLLTAATVGAALAVSGYVLQALSRNYLADPYLTGVSSGAGVTVALGLTFGLSFSMVPLAAFAGGLAASIVVAFLSRNPTGLSMTRMLLSGVALSTICSGLITLIITNGGNPVQSQGIFFWLAGGIGGRTWDELIPAATYTVVGCLVALVLSKQIRLLSLGTQQARSLGVNVELVQMLLLAVAVLMCGAAVSVSGLVGFVGLMAPHLSRRLYGRDERVHLICAALLGIALVEMSDLAARSMVPGQELPLGTLLSLIGGPFFLWLVSRQTGEELV